MGARRGKSNKISAFTWEHGRGLGNAERAGVQDLVEIRQADILTTDFSDATVVAIYLLPDFNARLRPRFNQLKTGSRSVSYMFKMPGVPPNKKVQWTKGDDERRVYLWVTPIPAPEKCERKVVLWPRPNAAGFSSA
jgi:hypothetical protein